MNELFTNIIQTTNSATSIIKPRRFNHLILPSRDDKAPWHGAISRIGIKFLIL